MPEKIVYRSRHIRGLLAGTVVTVPFTGIFVFMIGVQTSWSWVSFVALAALLVIDAVFCWRVARLRAVIRVDAERLTVRGVLGLGRVSYTWQELAAVGPVRIGDQRSAPVLAVRPVNPPAKPPRRTLPSGDPRLVYLVQLDPDSWSAPPDMILGGVARYAGTRFTDPLATVPTLRRRARPGAVTSGDHVTFGLRGGAILTAWVMLPLLAVFLIGFGVIILIATDEVYGLCMAPIALLPLGLSAFMAATMYRIRLDPDALTLVGLLGWRLVFPWQEQAAVGTVRITGTGPNRNPMEQRLRDTPVLALRPVRPLVTNPPRRVLGWDPHHQLLLIAGLNNWSAPGPDIVEALRRYAGPKWVGVIADLSHLPRRR